MHEINKTNLLNVGFLSVVFIVSAVETATFERNCNAFESNHLNHKLFLKKSLEAVKL